MVMTQKLQRQTLINTVGNVTYLIAQWFLSVITTRLLGYESVGILILAMSVGNVFTFIQLYGVRSFQSSDIARKYNCGDYLRTRFITTGTGILFCLIYILCSNYSRDVNISIILFMLFRSFEAFSDVYFGEFQREGRLELVGISMLIRGIVTVTLFFIGMYVLRSLNKALLAIMFGSILITVLLDSVLYLRIIPREVGTVAGMRGILKACFPLLMASLLPTVITTYPRVVLERYSGTELLGFYGNVSTPSVIITAIVPNLLVSIMPVYGNLVFRKDFIGIRRLWKKTIIGTFLILIACMLCVLVLGRPIMAWIYTFEILPYVHYLYYFLISTALLSA